LEKPEGDTEVGGLGTVGNLSGNRRGHREVDVDSLLLMRCRGNEPQERCRTPRGYGAGTGKHREGGSNPNERIVQGVASLATGSVRKTG
jgi:hypothetical protein